MKQAVKKKDIVKPSIRDIQAAIGILNEDENDLSYSNADKEIEFIPMPSAFEEATKLPGFPMGYLSLITGWSNTGKSTLKNCLIASCINNGILPVIFETENNMDFQYAIDCGVKATPVYGVTTEEVVDKETGEVIVQEKKVLKDIEGDFIYFNNAKLARRYGKWDYSQGKEVSSRRREAVIEDIAKAINDILDLQDEEVITQPICFIWDSVGSIQSFKNYASRSGNNMFDAGALSQAFNNIVNSRIPGSKSVSSPYTNTFVCVNKIWNDSMNSMGLPSIQLKGGKSFFYAARLILHLGGISKAATKKLTATAKGQTYNYGIISKIKVDKNQLPQPWNITYEGEIACVHNGLIEPSKVDDYKKNHIKDLLKKIEEVSNGKLNGASINDIIFGEKDEVEM